MTYLLIVQATHVAMVINNDCYLLIVQATQVAMIINYDLLAYSTGHTVAIVINYDCYLLIVQATHVAMVIRYDCYMRIVQATVAIILAYIELATGTLVGMITNRRATDYCHFAQGAKASTILLLLLLTLLPIKICHFKYRLRLRNNNQNGDPTYNLVRQGHMGVCDERSSLLHKVFFLSKKVLKRCARGAYSQFFFLCSL
jgi:hypothetical protein